MKKILYISFLISVSLSINNISFAESTLNKIKNKIKNTETNVANKIWGTADCSQYSTKTLSGLSDFKRCKSGLKPLDKGIFKSLIWKGKKNNKFDSNKPCHEYSTKTFTGLAAKIKCKSAKKN